MITIKKPLIFLYFFLLTSVAAFSSGWTINQKVLFQFEQMLFSNWEGTGTNYFAGSTRYIGNFNHLSSDSLFKLLNNAEAVIGIGYNATDSWKVQEDKISAYSSANHKLVDNINFNGTADLKTYFNMTSAYLLTAIGVSFIEGSLSIQDNPITARASFIKNERPVYEFGNYFKLSWKGTLDTNISLTVKLENFYKYGDVFWKEAYWNLEALTTFQINKLISSHLVINALYDTKQSKKLQAFEKITIGFTWIL